MIRDRNTQILNLQNPKALKEVVKFLNTKAQFFYMIRGTVFRVEGKSILADRELNPSDESFARGIADGYLLIKNYVGQPIEEEQDEHATATVKVRTHRRPAAVSSAE